MFKIYRLSLKDIKRPLHRNSANQDYAASYEAPRSYSFFRQHHKQIRTSTLYCNSHSWHQK